MSKSSRYQRTGGIYNDLFGVGHHNIYVRRGQIINEDQVYDRSGLDDMQNKFHKSRIKQGLSTIQRIQAVYFSFQMQNMTDIQIIL